MVKVEYTSVLKRFFPTLENSEWIEASSLNELLDVLNVKYPGIKGYLVDDKDCIRDHVNIFIGDSQIPDKNDLSFTLKNNDEVLIIQAISGG
ncbi:MAG: MoaD/ThiS family protein [Cyclobacteriaceae bacterium]|nr:MoaD/ThiS family protein [Cyclobacteriaceae bacterium]